VKTRLFHSSGAHVVYEYDVPQELRDLFTEAVRSVTVLGRAMDIVLVNVHDTMPAGDFDVFVPDAVNAQGTRVYLHTPVIGFIDSVFKKYVNKVKTLTVEDRGYTKNPQRVLSRALFELTQPVRIEQTSYVAAWVRHAAMREARKDVAEAISGHGDEGERLMIVPVPTLYYGDRMIRNVIVTGENQTLVRAAEAGLAGLHLTDNDGHDMGYLIPTEYDAVFSQFLHPSRRWISVTPVLMSGHDDRNERKRRRLLSKMFRHAGLPIPMAVSRMPAGAAAVTDFKVPSQHGHDKLHRMMCAVEFDTEVAGVVAIGTGRFTGLGVFANLAASATG
jgi:CRISPR-associated protein Csb2